MSLSDTTTPVWGPYGSSSGLFFLILCEYRIIFGECYLKWPIINTFLKIINKKIGKQCLVLLNIFINFRLENEKAYVTQTNGPLSDQRVGRGETVIKEC